MTLVDRSLRRQLTAAMALAMALALVLGNMALAQTSADEVAAVPIDDSCIGVPPHGFTDVPSNNTFHDEIACLKAYGFTEGTGDGSTYTPNGNTRRWQMVQFIARLAEEAASQVDGFDLPEASDQGFNDIGDLEQRFQDNINIMAEIGVVEGKNATTFDPFSNVRRDQMASFINRLQGAIQDSQGGNDAGFVTSENFFPDVPSSNVHRANINGLASVGIVQGKVTGRYDPRQFVTRGQMSAFIMRHYEVNVDAGVLESKFTGEPGEDGEVTLEANQAEAGGSVSGSVSDPGTVQNIAVSGCGFSNSPITLDGDGAFRITIPSGQAPGTCDLVFTVLRTDGSSTTTTIAFTVTAPPRELTDAPDLLSASVDGNDVVTYVFDEDADGAPLTAADFRLYNAVGNSVVPATVEVVGSDPTRIIADFDVAGIDAQTATLAAIRDDAVEDSEGNAAYASSVALSSLELEAGRTVAPDLESMDNVRTLDGAIVADFRFDEPVEEVNGVVPAPGNAVAGDFFLYTADGTAYDSTTISRVSADGRTLTIAFGGAPVDLPRSQVTRGGIDGGVVEDEDGDLNVTQTEPRTGTPAYSGGAVADRTDEPDLISVKVVGDNTVAFEFDESVSSDALDLDATAFVLYDSDGDTEDADEVNRSSSNSRVVNAEFPDNGTVGAAVGAYVTEDAVVANSDGEGNLIHELPLQDVSFAAGRTALPDLVSVDITVDAFGDADVVYTFDQAPPIVGNLELADFALVDAQGTRFTPTGVPDVDADANTVTFDGSTGQFLNSEAAAAVIGSVQDDSAAAPPAVITEGDVSVSRGETP